MDNPEATHTERKLFSMGYREGLIDGVRRFAWWKDGVQYVGSVGKTLTEAIEDIKRDCADSNYRQPY